jgi:hypothetical protein
VRQRDWADDLSGWRWHSQSHWAFPCTTCMPSYAPKRRLRRKQPALLGRVCQFILTALALHGMGHLSVSYLR